MSTRGVHTQIRFQVNAGAVDTCLAAVGDYAAYVREWAAKHGADWTWVTYQERDRPTRFVSVVWHSDEQAEADHREAGGTKAFAERIYPHVVSSEEITAAVVADSTERKPSHA